jgi:hypothetical protein
VFSPAETPLDIYAVKDQLKREDLGERQIEGFSCHGYQLEMRVGNHTNRYEIWISSQLNEVLWEKKVSGDKEDIFRLFNINRTDPAETLFVIPPDYKKVN